MTQDGLLKLIAETGYNVGYAAKKHLATLDIVEKIPGWISLTSIVVGIYALFVPSFEQKHVSAVLLIAGIASLFIGLYLIDKEKYAQAGNDLTSKFHDLRMLYQHVKSEPPNADFTSFAADHQRIQQEALQLPLPKQIFLSDAYAHYKFFWQAQTGWMDEQLHFRLVRDKLPLGATAIAAVGLIYLAWLGVQHLLAYVQAFCGA